MGAHSGGCRTAGAGRWRRRWIVAAIALTAVAPAARPTSATGQLLSPGKLSEAHASLEGVRGCTACHEPGQRGASDERCLACHEPLARRIAVGKGYHARLSRRACAECHREHFGREFALVRLDTAAFEHATETAFALRGAHARLACVDCHSLRRVAAADVREFVRGHGGTGRTMLGLPAACAACHAPEDPHGLQLQGIACDRCHDEVDWKGASRFDHERSGFPLTGLHRDVACAKCHKSAARPSAPARPGAKADGVTVRYRPVEHGTCAACHTDPHRGAMAGRCSDCHTTDGWDRLRTARLKGRFDHSLTRFALRGAHARLECAACHDPRAAAGGAVRLRFPEGVRARAYPRPEAKACESCHLDAHDGVFANARGGPSCSRCHGEAAWAPTSFGPERHDSTTGFALTGSHIAVACDACHRPRGEVKPLFRRLAATCRDCHAADDPHGGRYGEQGCEACHRTTAFTDVAFDHARAAGRACSECHASDSPHGEQFGERPCSACHGTTSFRIEAFDHSRTEFPLSGSHARLACATCHRPVEGGRPAVRYTPLPTHCAGCHSPASGTERSP